MAQSTAAMTTTTTPEQNLASLEAILATVKRTRSSLPALVKTVLPDSPLPSQTAADRATAYRTASTECHVAIRTLADQLEAVEAILAETDQSEQRDQTDIVVRSLAANDTAPRKKQAISENKPTWARVGEILAAGGTTAQVRANEPYKPVHAVPTSPGQLEALLDRWNKSYKRVRVVVSERRADRPTALQLTLRGVLRAKVALRWASDETSGAERCEPDYVACYSLKEEKPIHADSQFSLFRSISNEAMLALHRARVRASEGQEDGALLEEVLAFLSDPPLPF